jgi:hypothetical protein
MNFKEATDGLFHRIRHAELAKMLNVSVAAIRQARLSRTAKAYRKPPRNWHQAIIKVAQERISRLQKLIGSLKRHYARQSEKKGREQSLA